MVLPQKGTKLHPNCIKNNFPTPINLLQVLPITQNIISDHFLKKKFQDKFDRKCDLRAARRRTCYLISINLHVLFFPRAKLPTQPFQTLIWTLFSGPSWPRKNLIFFLLFKFGQDLPAAKNPVFRGALVLDISAVRQTDTVTNWDYYIDASTRPTAKIIWRAIAWPVL